MKLYLHHGWARRAAQRAGKWHTVDERRGRFFVREMTQDEKERAIAGENFNKVLLELYAPIIQEQLDTASRLFRLTRQ